MKRTEWLGVLLRKKSLEIEKAANQVAEPLGLSFAQVRFLWFLYEQGDTPVRQVDLEAEFSMTNPSVTSVLRSLEDKHLVQRVPHPEDRRSKIVRLTEEAVSYWPQLEKARTVLESRITANLSEAQQEQLKALLQRIDLNGGQ